MSARSNAVEQAEEYYDSDAADAFYKSIWGGEDIHIGLYDSDDDTIAAASRRTVERMVDHLGDVSQDMTILDLGAGYGGAARYLAERFGCHVTCLNLSETQNALNRKLTEQAGLSDLVSVVHGDFEHIPETADRYDIVWSQDAILHSGNRTRVLNEVQRVLRPGGRLIFTDPMQSDSCPQGVLQPILDRINLATLASPAFYRTELSKLGFEELRCELMTDQLRTHYARIGQALSQNYDEAVERSGQTYVDNMMRGLKHWVDGADKGHLAWGIMGFRLAG